MGQSVQTSCSIQAGETLGDHLPERLPEQETLYLYKMFYVEHNASRGNAVVEPNIILFCHLEDKGIFTWELNMDSHEEQSSHCHCLSSEEEAVFHT